MFVRVQLLIVLSLWLSCLQCETIYYWMRVHCWIYRLLSECFSLRSSPDNWTSILDIDQLNKPSKHFNISFLLFSRAGVRQSKGNRFFTNKRQSQYLAACNIRFIKLTDSSSHQAVTYLSFLVFVYVPHLFDRLVWIDNFAGTVSIALWI